MDETEFRAQAEQIRLRAEVNAAADVQRREQEAERIALRVAAAAAIRRTNEIAQEDRNLSAGYTPHRMESETEAAFQVRRETWLKSPDGIVFLERRRQERERENERMWPLVVEAAGVPTRIAGRVRAGNLTETASLRAAQSFEGLLLLLAGDVGVGKSMAAAAWLLAAYLPGGPGRPAETPRKKLDVLWLSAARLARYPRYDDEKMGILLNANRLVIDDLFTEYADTNGSFITTLDEVINDRLGNGLPTVMTTNATGETFKARYGERIADRIREGNGFIRLAGESLRRQPPPPELVAPPARPLTLVPPAQGEKGGVA